MIEAMTQMQATGPLYYSASAVIAAIDALALMLTGQRSYFDLKGALGVPVAAPTSEQQGDIRPGRAGRGERSPQAAGLD